MVQPQLSLHYETSPALPDDKATAPPLGRNLISWSAWGPLAVEHRQAMGCRTEHRCHSLMPKELQPRRRSRLQRTVNKYLPSPLTVPRENTNQPQQALKWASQGWQPEVLAPQGEAAH